MVRPARPVERPKTQEERLAEAAETEKLNLASLEAFQKREEERKRASKRVTTCVLRPRGMACHCRCTKSCGTFGPHLSIRSVDSRASVASSVRCGSPPRPIQ